MLGWRIKAFGDLPVFHHRPTGSGDRRVRNLFREGRMDYSVGSSPLFEIMKIVRRMQFRPYVVGSLIRLSGFVWGYCRHEKRPVSQEFIKFLRKEQNHAMRDFFLSRPKRPAQEDLGRA